MTTDMRALVFSRFGPPDTLREVRTDRPMLTDDRILVRVRAVSINPYDLHFLYGDPYVARPMLGIGIRRPRKPTTLGSDVAGTVEAVGGGVSGFAPGDEVFGLAGLGAMAEFVAVSPRSLAHKPPSLSFEEAASLPMAGVTALQALRDVGKLQPGQRVLINGAAGGVGSMAVQLAKALGAAEVTGVCSATNAERVRSLGADRTIDYATDDFTRLADRYDLVLDTIGNHSTRALARVVKPEGVLVLVGGGGGRWLGPIGQIIGSKLVGPFVKPRVATMVAVGRAADLEFIAGLVEAGKVRPNVDRTYPFAKAAAALAYLETRHARGKVVITVAIE